MVQGLCPGFQFEEGIPYTSREKHDLCRLGKHPHSKTISQPLCTALMADCHQGCARNYQWPLETGTIHRFAPSQWETALLCKDVSHWLGASLESALHSCQSMMHCKFP